MDNQPNASNTPQGKRGWFQIHLLTAVALMIVAGALLGANLKDWTSPSQVGWPFTFINQYTHYSLPSVVGTPVTPVAMFWSECNYRLVVFDGIVALLCLMMTGFVFEARTWGWSGGKIFVWAFIGTALSLQILNNLFQLMAESPGLFIRPH